MESTDVPSNDVTTSVVDAAEYERQRLDNIARNQSRLAALGLQEAVLAAGAGSLSTGKTSKRKAGPVPSLPARNRPVRAAAQKAKEKLVDADETTDAGKKKRAKREDGSGDEESGEASSSSTDLSEEEDDEDEEDIVQQEPDEDMPTVTPTPKAPASRGRGRGRAQRDGSQVEGPPTRGRGRGRGRKAASTHTDPVPGLSPVNEEPGKAPNAKGKKAPGVARKPSGGKNKQNVLVPPTETEVAQMFDLLANGKNHMTREDVVRLSDAFGLDSSDAVVDLMMQGAHVVTGVAAGGRITFNDFTRLVSAYLTA